ncbi:hypothetical protein [Hymenobacter defluvii]|uniref:Uncharacterized protein n=1 Tax=Hymenobacter defluvii TaxID=2054411 RepID=A0ABS3THV6_9BACT|nr:hypothetical protein [Hymenobacter defluvii]MBO3273242.1 hypothetical protein [Hymenobacter defluvii]
MLLRFSLWLLLGTLLTACQPDLDSGPLLDFVGGSRYTAYTRIINTPADTLTYKIFAATTKAQNADTADAPNLTNMRIEVTYNPRLNPVDYTGLSISDHYDRGDTLVVFNRSMKRKTFAFQNTFSTRSTPGYETWKFTSTDDQNQTSTASFRITVRPNNNDSTLAYHRYTVGLQAPRTFTSRSYIALLPGLTFPRYIGSQTDSPRVPYSDVYGLIDLVYLPGADNSAVLASPSSVPALSTLWPTDSTTRRTTRLRTTTLNASTFAATASPADLTTAYNSATTPASTRTEILVKGRVYAFRTQDAKFGLIYVENLITTPIPAAKLQVHITK